MRITRRSIWAPGFGALALLFATAAAAADAAPARTGPSSGLALPRFVSLGATEINVRTGPGTRHPIKWRFHRAGLPVMVVDEVDVWRQIQDQEGDDGWIHASLLSGRRTVLIRNDVQPLLRQPRIDGRIVLRLEPGVIAALETCRGDWCRVDVASQGDHYEGWLPRDAVWGIGDQEVVE